jgi:hypothetical protein
MDALGNIGVLLGSSWASGINLYMTVALLGIADKAHWITLPGSMKALSNPLIIIVAILMYVVEFVADKIPFVDSAWDTIHTFIRPLGGAALGFLAAANVGPAVQIPVALVTGAVAMDSHLTKATTRVAINSTAPGANIVASVTEDAAVFGVLYFAIKHPVLTGLFVVCFIAFSIWFLTVMFKFLRKVLCFLFGSKDPIPKTP